MLDKKYSIIELIGGLGNMLFQIATTYSLSLRDNKEFFCDSNMTIIPHHHYSHYKDNIFRKIKFKNNVEDLDSFYSENGFNYNPIPKFTGNVRLRGYFQSEKYFLDYRNEILDLFEPNEETKIKIDDFFSEFSNKRTCSIHVRRGDYVGIQNYHCLQEIDYYKKSIEMIGIDTTFLIFSDDIDWCKDNFYFLDNKIFITGFSDHEQLYLMSICNDNIIANSTFSWWGAWMNKNDNKKVISPKKWFGDSNQHLNVKDVYCNNWLII
jgi:hypothetical protein